MIVQKQDGAFLYATTDLATLDYRQTQFNPDEVLYVVDHRQSDHFEKLFVVAKKWGMEPIALRHISFGTVLGHDGKPFKTRSGTSVGLETLLDDAVNEAKKAVCAPERTERFDPPLGEAEKDNIARVVGHGAIKYFDLLHHRTSDYVFDLEKMVSLDGNTSAYVQYAYARVQSLLRTAGVDEASVLQQAAPISLTAAHERTLVLMLLRFGETLELSLQDYRPSLLVDYLYNVAKSFSGFFENCPVMKAGDESLKQSRIAISTLTGRVLREGLALLGIDVVPRM
jgi:arginyl-tRNA synthetase